MKTCNMPGRKNARRIGALERKQAQLESGNKPTKDGNIPMNDKQKEKLEKEIEKLKSLVVQPQLALSTKTKKYRGPR